MNKLICLLAVSIVLVIGANAQDNKKSWNEGKLTWSDFQTETSNSGVSELRFFIGYNTEKQKFRDTTLRRIKAFGYIDRKLSWVNPEFINDQNLKYNQVIFALLELYRRKLQYELDRINSIPEAESKFQMIHSQFIGEIEKYKNETTQGQDLSKINLWDYRITRELQMTSDNRVPDFTTGNFGYGANLALGSGFFTNSLGDHFGPSFNFTFGFDLAYKNTILFLNATLAGDKVRKDFMDWKSGQRANIAILDISLGQALINNRKLKLSPFTGLGITEFTGTTQSEPKKDLRIVDYNYLLGINFDFKLKTVISITPLEFMSLREKVETSIRVKLYMTHTNYNPGLKGNSINLTVGMNGFGNLIRLN